MSRNSILRIQKHTRNRHSHGRSLQLAAAGGVLSDGRVTTAGNLNFGMPAEEDTRSALISSAISAGLHLLALAAIVVIGILAEEAIEEVIPVQIINELVELPGSNQPAALPKMLSRPLAAAAAVAPAPSAVAAVPAVAAVAPTLTAERAPTPVEMAKVESKPLAAQAAIKPAASAADIGDVKPLEFDTAELASPVVDHVAPTSPIARTEINTMAPRDLSDFSQASAVTHAAGSNASALQTASAAAVAGSSVDTGVSSQFLAGTGGYGGGGDPNGVVGTVPCMQSAFVGRYTDEIERRTRARWVVPMGSTAQDSVTLQFKLDHAGSVTQIKAINTTSERYGQSAIEALRTASPFPALDDNVRCLSEKKRLTLTFRNS